MTSSCELLKRIAGPVLELLHRLTGLAEAGGRRKAVDDIAAGTDAGYPADRVPGKPPARTLGADLSRPQAGGPR